LTVSGEPNILQMASSAKMCAVVSLQMSSILKTRKLAELQWQGNVRGRLQGHAGFLKNGQGSFAYRMSLFRSWLCPSKDRQHCVPGTTFYQVARAYRRTRRNFATGQLVRAYNARLRYVQKEKRLPTSDYREAVS
jgi:hypothetical protein